MKERKNWDKLLPYLLLHIEKCLRSPLDSHRLSYCMDGQHKDFWIFYLIRGKVRPVASSESVVSHILSMREKLSQISELVYKNLTKAQVKQKQWYNKSARSSQKEIKY